MPSEFKVTAEQKASLLQTIWSTNPDNVEAFRNMFREYVTLQTKFRAGRILLLPPQGVRRFLSTGFEPRPFIRASIRARLIEVVGEWETT